MLSAVNVNADGQLLCSCSENENSLSPVNRKINKTVIRNIINTGMIAILIETKPFMFHKKTSTRRKPKMRIPHQNGILNNSKVAPPPANMTTVVENKYNIVIASYT